jgi:iron complex outermembrane receptor protein
MKKKNFMASNKVLFKKWQTKSYAVFNSLHREIKILALSAAYFTIFGYMQTLAQVSADTISKKIDLDEIQVTARRSPALYTEVGRVITVIPRNEIDKLPVQSLHELLNYAMNVDVRQRGPLGVQSDVSIRGGSFDQVMILLNGINITDPQTGHHNLNLPVDLQSIERVEILEGPGARVHGPNAFSGAINFVTGTKPVNSTTIHAMGGQHGLYNLAANTTIHAGKGRHYLALNQAASEGYIQNTDFKNKNIFYAGKWQVDQESLDFQIGYTDKAFGANAFYTPKYPEQFEAIKTTFASLKFTSGTKVKLTPALYWRRNQDRFELFRNEAPSWYVQHNYHLTDVYGGSLNATIPWKFGQTSFGGEIRGEHIWSNNIGVPMNDTLPVPGEADGMFTKKYGRSNTSVFVEHAYSKNSFSVAIGVMMNKNSGLDWKTKLFPGIDASYWFNNTLKTFVSVNKSLRMPTFTDLFYDGPSNQGNPHLKPEEALTYEGGMNYVSGWLSAKGSMYYRDAENLIDWGRTEGEVEYVTRNLTSIQSWGVELSANIDFVKLNGPASFVKSLKAGYHWMDQNKESLPNYESAYVLDYLKEKFYLSIRHRIVYRLEANLNLLYQNRNGGYIEFIDNGGSYMEVPTDYEPFVTADARLQWQGSNYKLYVEASNLFDVKYVDLGNVHQPGAWFKAGIQFTFE